MDKEVLRNGHQGWREGCGDGQELKLPRCSRVLSLGARLGEDQLRNGKDVLPRDTLSTRLDSHLAC